MKTTEELAREAGMIFYPISGMHGGNDAALDRFAALVRAEALEEAEAVCEKIAVDKWALYKGRAPHTGQEPGRAADFTQGQSDGAELCEQAIRALKDKK